MSRNIDIRIHGIPAIAKAFNELERKLARKVISGALRDGAKLVMSDVRPHVPVDTGKGKKSLRVRVSKVKKGERNKFIALAVLLGDVPYKGSTWYMGLQESGWHSGKRIRKAGKTTGHVGGRKIPGKHFLRGSYLRTNHPVQELVIGRILDGIEKYSKA